MTINLDKVVEYIINHKRGKAFIGYREENIREELEEAYRNNCLEVSHDDEGNINGVIVAEPRIHIKQILTSNKGILYKLCYIMNLKFAGIKWQGFRDGKGEKLKIFHCPDRMLEIAKNQLKGE